MKGYKSIAKIEYARKVKALKPGKVQYFKLHGKRVKTYVGPDGRTLEILEAPKGLLPDLNKYKLLPQDGILRQVPIEKPKSKPKSEPAEPESPPQPQEPEPQPPEEEKKEELKPQKEEAEEAPKEPVQESAPEIKLTPKPKSKPTHEFTEKQRRQAELVQVPQSGIIPTPFINWDSIPEKCNITAQSEKSGRPINYVDYPIPEAPKGLLPELRDQFRINRLYQDVLPANVWIRGPPGTGKSQVVKKFAEETGLPYWGVIGRQGIRADELLGHWDPKGSGNFEWVEGVITKAVRAGGILHFDEANVIDPAVLMRLDELMDNKRQLYLDETGELIKAHPDLFIIFTTNPETFEGVKNMPDPIKDRLVKKYYLDYPPENVEKKIIESKLRYMGVKPSEFSVAGNGSLTGRYAQDVEDYMKFVQGLREYQTKGSGEQLSYVPSPRETIGFIQDLRSGKDFYTAINTNVMGAYRADPEEYHRVEEALGGVRRR